MYRTIISIYLVTYKQMRHNDFGMAVLGGGEGGGWEGGGGGGGGGSETPAVSPLWGI